MKEKNEGEALAGNTNLFENELKYLKQILERKD